MDLPSCKAYWISKGRILRAAGVCVYKPQTRPERPSREGVHRGRQSKARAVDTRRRREKEAAGGPEDGLTISGQGAPRKSRRVAVREAKRSKAQREME